MKRTEYNVTSEQFIAAWQQAASVQEVCARLNMPYGIVLARACNYRGLGVPLKKMPRKRRGLDVEAMRRLAESLAGGPEEAPARTRREDPPPESEAEVAEQLRKLLHKLHHKKN